MLYEVITIPVSATDRVVFNRKGDGYISRLDSDSDGIPQVAMAQAQSQAPASNQASKPKAAVATSRVVKGQIRAAFGTDARLSGLTANQIVQVTRLFQGRIDFRRDLRKGDHFKVLLDKPAVITSYSIHYTKLYDWWRTPRPAPWHHCWGLRRRPACPAAP